MSLSVRNLDKRFDGIHVLHDFSIEIKDEKITAFVGPNGAGKTTLFNIITGFIQADSGSVFLDKVSLLGQSPWYIAKYSLSLVKGLCIICNIAPQISTLLAITCLPQQKLFVFFALQLFLMLPLNAPCLLEQVIQLNMPLNVTLPTQ